MMNVSLVETRGSAAQQLACQVVLELLRFRKLLRMAALSYGLSPDEDISEAEEALAAFDRSHPELLEVLKEANGQ
mgnify:CR=1 FL=1